MCKSNTDSDSGFLFIWPLPCWACPRSCASSIRPQCAAACPATGHECSRVRTNPSWMLYGFIWHPVTKVVSNPRRSFICLFVCFCKRYAHTKEHKPGKKCFWFSMFITYKKIILSCYVKHGSFWNVALLCHCHSSPVTGAVTQDAGMLPCTSEASQPRAITTSEYDKFSSRMNRLIFSQK